MIHSSSTLMKFAVDENSASEVLTESTHQLFYCPTDVKILIIDDETAICQVIERALAQPHFNIESVSQHDKIDAALQNGNYSLMIMDYVLPGIDPKDLFDKVKQNQPNASVLVVTSDASVSISLNNVR